MHLRSKNCPSPGGGISEPRGRGARPKCAGPVPRMRSLGTSRRFLSSGVSERLGLWSGAGAERDLCGRPDERGYPAPAAAKQPTTSRSSPRAPASKRSCSRIARKGEPAIAEFDHVLSSEPPMRKPEPGAPRMLGSGIELDTDLRDCIPLHVAHNQFHGTEARAVSDRRPAVEPARQKLR